MSWKAVFENPVGLNRVEYEVRLDSPGHVEAVQLGHVGRLRVGLLIRFLRPIAYFVVSPSQWAKIQKDTGKIRITEEQVQRANAALMLAPWRRLTR